MPEMRFVIRWPDGRQESCYSPSLVVSDYFREGESYALDDFLVRGRAALPIASERVRAKYGYACSLALGQLARIEAAAAHFARPDDARVVCESFPEGGDMSPTHVRLTAPSSSAEDRRDCPPAISCRAQASSMSSSRRSPHAQMARRALGQVLPGDAELAMPVAGPSL